MFILTFWAWMLFPNFHNCLIGGFHWKLDLGLWWYREFSLNTTDLQIYRSQIYELAWILPSSISQPLRKLLFFSLKQTQVTWIGNSKNTRKNTSICLFSSRNLGSFPKQSLFEKWMYLCLLLLNACRLIPVIQSTRPSTLTRVNWSWLKKCAIRSVATSWRIKHSQCDVY